MSQDEGADAARGRPRGASLAGLAGVVAPTLFAAPGTPYIPGSACRPAAGPHAIAALIALTVMAWAPKTAGAPFS